MKTEHKQLIFDSINRRPVERVPMMYRADEIISQHVIDHFGIDGRNWIEGIIENLGADLFSGGPSLNDFYCYTPKYVGPDFDCDHDGLFFFTFGISTKCVYDEQGRFFEYDFFQNPPLAKAETADDLAEHRFPTPEWFDFGQYQTLCSRKSPAWYPEDDSGPECVNAFDIRQMGDQINSTYFFNTIFIISSYMRGMGDLLMDMSADQHLAHALIDRVGETCVELNRANLASIGDRIEIFGMWDDFATQDNMFMSPSQWREYFKPWYKKIIADAKEHGLIVYFHCCGNLWDVVPDLIDIGVDILDPIQTSARRMNLKDLKREFGRDLCFHGGIDIQRLLPRGTPEEVRAEVHEIKELFDGDGGLILGPCHLMTRDIPIENILAMYE